MLRWKTINSKKSGLLITPGFEQLSTVKKVVFREKGVLNSKKSGL
jgi:hypothetical protein